MLKGWSRLTRQVCNTAVSSAAVSHFPRLSRRRSSITHALGSVFLAPHPVVGARVPAPRTWMRVPLGLPRPIFPFDPPTSPLCSAELWGRGFLAVLNGRAVPIRHYISRSTEHGASCRRRWALLEWMGLWMFMCAFIGFTVVSYFGVKHLQFSH